MAKKRRIGVEGEPESDLTTSESNQGKKNQEDIGWSIWFRKTYLKYWYVVGCAFLDIIIALELERTTPREYSASLSITFFIGLVILESFTYRFIWKRPKQ